ncbi:hypothetical protein PBY51_018248 [Eleginops maclovinus]|nr:hypothetical protein PBY51_018248 [Eleginops maclovinus]
MAGWNGSSWVLTSDHICLAQWKRVTKCIDQIQSEAWITTVTSVHQDDFRANLANFPTASCSTEPVRSLWEMEQLGGSRAAV